MRTSALLILCSVLAAAQNAAVPASSPGVPLAGVAPMNELIIPAGTRVPVALKHALSTKSAREGDAVYAETTFPLVLNDRVLIPANTYVQGRISNIKRPGRVKGRAEVLIHFTTLIYPSGYTILLPGAVDNVPGADQTKMKGEEGTIQQNGSKAKDVGTVASTASTGAVIGGLSQGGKGALIGAGAGTLVGTAIALLSRGNDVRLESGTTLEMVIQRPITVDARRVPTTTR